MTPEETLKKIGINYPGTQTGNEYIVDLGDSNNYAKVYSILDNSDLVNLDPTLTVSSENGAVLIYYDDNYVYTLRGNFTVDSYKLVIEEEE